MPGQCDRTVGEQAVLLWSEGRGDDDGDDDDTCLVSAIVLWESRLYCCRVREGVMMMVMMMMMMIHAWSVRSYCGRTGCTAAEWRGGDDHDDGDDTCLVSETVMWENRRAAVE